MRGSISIIGLKGVWIVPLKKPDQSSNPPGARGEISKMNYLGELQLYLVRRLGISVNEGR